MSNSKNDPELPLAGGHQGSPVDGWRGRLIEFVESGMFRAVVVMVIVLDSAVLGLQTMPEFRAQQSHIIHYIDDVALTFFCIELTLRIVAHRAAFFRNGWSLFDLAVVGVAVIPIAGDYEILRILRVLRILRLVTVVPRLRKVVKAMVSAFPGMNAALILLGIVFYMFAVITTKVLGDQFPGLFGTVQASMFSLFQIMTLESWASGIVRPVMQLHPHAPMIFVPFILLTAYGIVNLFVAMVVAAMAQVSQEESEDEKVKIQELSDEVRHLREEIRLLRDESGKR